MRLTVGSRITSAGRTTMADVSRPVSTPNVAGRVAGLRDCIVALGLTVLAVPASANSDVELHIPAEDLGVALKELGAATQRQMLFHEAAVTGRRSPELNGRYTLDDAFGILL